MVTFHDLIYHKADVWFDYDYKFTIKIESNIKTEKRYICNPLIFNLCTVCDLSISEQFQNYIMNVYVKTFSAKILKILNFFFSKKEKEKYHLHINNFNTQRNLSKMRFEFRIQLLEFRIISQKKKDLTNTE